MLTEEQFDEWCRRNNICEKARELIERIRNSEPSRNVQSSAMNMSGTYCSQKTGLTMQFESHKGELPLMVTDMEYNKDVLEYYDQPVPIELRYRSKTGRWLTVIYTPDFFVIRRDCAGYEEFKKAAELQKLSEKQPNRYIQTDKGIWRCPPADEYAEKFGLYFRVRTSNEINWKYYRNLEYLQDYHRHPYDVSEDAEVYIRSRVEAEPGISLLDLLGDRENRFTADDVNALLASGKIYFDIKNDCFDYPETVKLYRSAEEAECRKATITQDSIYDEIDLSVGKRISWDGVIHDIINEGESGISLQSDKGELKTLTHEQVRKLVGNSQIRINKTPGTRTLPEAARRRVNGANKDALKEANDKADIVRRYLAGERNLGISGRTIRHWVRKYKIAQQAWGEGYIGLIPNNKGKGNRNSRFSIQEINLVNDTIKDRFENGQGTALRAYGFLKDAQNEENKKENQEYLKVPSYPTFCRYVSEKRPRHQQTLNREGSRAAYEFEPFYWELEMTTPRHGSRPFEVVHIDHTELPIELVCPWTGKNQGKPWATIMTDAFSRRFLSAYITYDPPSYRSNMMAFRECVRRFNRLPQTVIVDGGMDFHGDYLKYLLARYEITKKKRPPAKARFGSVCERLFGTSDVQLVHNLLGNTKLMKNVRKVTKAFNAKNLAAWDLTSFAELFKTWAYELYDTEEHPALGESPREAYERGLELTGFRKNRLIPYDRDFEIATLPTTRNGCAKVFPGRGMKVNYLYYWTNEFNNPEIERKKVDVRFDPWNMGIVYVYVPVMATRIYEWVQCESQYYAVFQGRTEKEIMQASEELRKQRSNSGKKYTVNAAQLADYFRRYVIPKEKELQQRREEQQKKAKLEVVDGGRSGPKAAPPDSKASRDRLSNTERRIVPREIYKEF